MVGDSAQWWQYGAIGGLAFTLLSLFVWILVKLLSRTLSHFDELAKSFGELKLFIASCTKSLERLTDGQVEAARRTDDITVKLNDIAARKRGF